MSADFDLACQRMIRALLRGYRWMSKRTRRTIPRQSGDRRYRRWRPSKITRIK